jgi:hypothetical protein
MLAMVFEETHAIATVGQLPIGGDSGEGWSYTRAPNGSYVNAADGPQAITFGGTVGAKGWFKNVSGRTLNGNVTVEIIKPNGQRVMKDSPSGSWGNGVARSVELTVPADQYGTYQCHYFGELWE